MTATEKVQKRSSLDQMASTAIAALSEKDPKIQTKINSSLASAVANMKLTKVPIGGGRGARSYKLLLIVESQEIFDRLKNSTWELQAGAEVSAGTASAEGSSSDLVNKGFTTYVLSDGGASATVTARVIRIKINHELTE
jgi:lipid-binding SYLF domain-containing protein